VAGWLRHRLQGLGNGRRSGKLTGDSNFEYVVTAATTKQTRWAADQLESAMSPFTHVHGCLCLVIAVVLVNGCKFGGRWDRHSGGGSFIGCSPSVSHRGSTIVFASPRTGHGDIYEYDESNSNLTRLTDNSNYEGDPEYSYDDKKIVFVREEDTIGHIWIMNADGTGQQRITNDRGYDSGPSFSPDGSQIVFTRNVAELKFLPGTTASAEIFIVNADGTGETRLTNNEQADWEPRFSPDGKQIVYSIGSQGIWTMNTDGTEPKRLSIGSSPSYSPDGSKVVFVSGQYGRSLSIMDSDGTNEHQIHQSGSKKSHPTFSPDGKHVVFLDQPKGGGIGEICRFNLDDNQLERITLTEPTRKRRKD